MFSCMPHLHLFNDVYHFSSKVSLCIFTAQQKSNL